MAEPRIRVSDLLDRAGPCDRCGVVTTDWMMFDGKTGTCKCNNCYQPNRQKAVAEQEKFMRELREGRRCAWVCWEMDNAGNPVAVDVLYEWEFEESA